MTMPSNAPAAPAGQQQTSPLRDDMLGAIQDLQRLHGANPALAEQLAQAFRQFTSAAVAVHTAPPAAAQIQGDMQRSMRLRDQSAGLEQVQQTQQDTRPANEVTAR